MESEPPFQPPGYSGDRPLHVHESHEHPITVSAGTAFKMGFFGALGAWVFSLIPGVVLVILLFGAMASCAAGLSRPGR